MVKLKSVTTGFHHRAISEKNRSDTVTHVIMRITARVECLRTAGQRPRFSHAWAAFTKAQQPAAMADAAAVMESR
jgi:hypothetical protein